MPRPQSEDKRLHLERARDREGSSKTVWYTNFWRGECPSIRWWWRESNESDVPPCRQKCMETAENGRFCDFLANKLLKMSFFAQKYSTRYTPKTFFEEYINFKNFCYLRHCGVLPVQSYESHICP
jgi:hypothetical protein